jgi:hypothetical protein
LKRKLDYSDISNILSEIGLLPENERTSNRVLTGLSQEQNKPAMRRLLRKLQVEEDWLAGLAKLTPPKSPTRFR